ncbi:N-acetylmuramoyl-L-alanine amidase [Clostridium cavendishii DSM 21758]|uniref:N-acetylmuramoyl-L-alanine amidase n=1 Tax=Clostridium cavendishii DSM 21758 TaxID=1121302 RepID=A0A1M6M2U9_9CLOT|nr:N-acetylmuramoyl-L-alanine amidase CwlD [Clostridium cavendishii]SHJ77730.1 N-acetylmuramoyl-L-alanine amidase [Clostridium cavendishii DSM 21758]
MKFKKQFIFFMIIAILVSTTINAYAKEKKDTNEGKIILLDAGHGGFDGGAQSKNGTIEKDINLAITLKLKSNLEAKGYKVFMTRDNDDGLYDKGKTVKNKKVQDLTRRVELKKETKCDAFVSIHQNMFPQGKYKGAQVWYASNEKSKKLAESLQDSLKANVDPNNNRVCKPAGEQYKILRDNYEGASVIIECGFLSNYEEEQNLKSDKYQEKLAEAIGLGVDKYFKE